MRFKFSWLAALSFCLVHPLLHAQGSKPTITLDEYLNTVSITGTSLSPDASAAVIATEAPDWKASEYRHDLWLWTAERGLQPLTHSGSDETPKWSPDGKWIAFTSDRAPAGSADGDADAEGNKCSRIWILAATGGEALPLYSEKLDVHTFAWSPDSTSIYFSAKSPLTHDEEDQQKDDWKDVVRWREQYRGDVLLKLAVAPALAQAVAVPAVKEAPNAAKTDAEPSSKLPTGAETVTKVDLAISEIEPSPDGKLVAFLTEPIHKRIENPADFEIFTVEAAAVLQSRSRITRQSNRTFAGRPTGDGFTSRWRQPPDHLKASTTMCRAVSIGSILQTVRLSGSVFRLTAPSSNTRCCLMARYLRWV